MTTSVEAPAKPSTILEIPLARLRESPFNTRRNFDAAKLKELADSIRAQGLLTPLLVRANTSPSLVDPAATGFEILAGARRSRAAAAAGLERVPCILCDADDTAAQEIITMDNLQREDLSELEEAQGFKELLDMAKYDVAELAKRLGKSASYIYQRVKLVELAPDAKDALVKQKITPGHAILIARLQPADQDRVMKRVAERQKHERPMSVREVGEWIKEEIHLDVTKAPWKLDDATLLPRAGACNGCPKRQKNACEDPTCYEEKMRAHLAKAATEFSGLSKISAAYAPDDADVLGFKNWQPAEPKSCPDTITGLVVEAGWAHGKERKRGDRFSVCTNQKCKLHWKAAPAESVYKRPAAELAKERKRKAELTRRGMLFRLLAEKSLTPNHEDARTIVGWMADQLDHDHAKRVCDAMGWPPAATSYGGKNYEGAIQRQLKQMNTAQVEHWMLLLVVAATELYYSSYEANPKAGLLEQYAKRAKVSLPKAGAVPVKVPVKAKAAKPTGHKTATKKK